MSSKQFCFDLSDSRSSVVLSEVNTVNTSLQKACSLEGLKCLDKDVDMQIKSQLKERVKRSW